MSDIRSRTLAIWIAAGASGFCFLPWYDVPDGIASLAWLADIVGRSSGSALIQALTHGRPWLLPAGALLVAAIAVLALPLDRPEQSGTLTRRSRATVLVALGSSGFAWTLLQGFAIGVNGWTWTALAGALPLVAGQPGLGLGAVTVLAAFAMIAAQGLAARGHFNSDAFVAGSVVAIAILLALFTFYPVLRVLASAIEDNGGAIALGSLPARIHTARLWSLGCLGGGSRCGVAWNTLLLAFACAACCTAGGLAFALLGARTTVRMPRLLRFLTVLPIITPPFVLGLGVILLFGRAGLVNHLAETWFGLEPGRWIYGMPGVLIAQVFAFTPIAFLVIAGVLEGLAPCLDEAAHTLRADRARIFAEITLPLLKPGLANAFLISFIESIADFGNPILLGGNFGVLSTEIFFSVVGAQIDPGRAAALSLLLLAFALIAFHLQRRILAGRSYTTIGGKGERGIPAPLPDGVRRSCYAFALPWMTLTIVLYAMAIAGGFTENWGRDYTPTLRHYVKAFGVEWTAHGVLWAGAAWDSLFTTLRLSAIAAPVTAMLGILSAYLLTRQRFVGRDAFEFGTMLAFAIPGTVIGVAYILAFNAPPIEITGTGLVLIACFVFRNLPVGVRAGMASMAQIDRSLDEASTTLHARGLMTFRRVILPLLRPALVAALIYSFVRAVTTVSAVIFLVSARHEMATTYIINRVVNGDYGIAIAYSTVLIVLMLIAIALIQRLVGRRAQARKGTTLPAAAAIGAAAGAG